MSSLRAATREVSCEEEADVDVEEGSAGGDVEAETAGGDEEAGTRIGLVPALSFLSKHIETDWGIRGRRSVIVMMQPQAIFKMLRD